MSYRRALVTRWSRRDRLAVLVVGVTSAFLVGSVVVLLAVGAQTTAVASEFGASASVELVDGPADPEEGVAFPVATATDAEGRERTVVGVPPDADPPGDLEVGPPANGLRGPGDRPTDVTLRGTAGTVEGSVAPREGSESFFPESWYVADADAVERLGATRTLVVRPTDGPVPARGAPVVGALAFFLAGTRQLLGLLAVASAGAAVLVGIVVHSVTRMSVRDRREAIAVLRATGATPRRVLGVFALRAGLLTATGLALGYSLGVILPNAAVTTAVTLGLPVGIDLAVDPRTAGVLAAVLGALLAVGTVAGVLAARPAATGPPAGGRDRSPADRLPAVARPETLSAGAFVPTAGALAVFVAFVLVAASLSGVLAGAGAADGATIAQPGATHPVASQVDAGYADALRAAGIAASPEILLFGTYEGHPFPARGVEFDAYRTVEGAEIVDGRAPRANATDEAVVGADLARTLGVSVGDRIALGGSTRPAVATVEVVGTFDAPGAADDHLLVSLPVARHLRGMGPDAVNQIRIDERPSVDGDRDEDGTAGGGIAVLDASAPDRVAAGGTVAVRVRLRNVGTDRAQRRVTVRLGDRERVVEATLAPGETATREATFSTEEPGERRLVVGDLRRNVTVVDPDALSFARVPEAGPPNATVRLRVTDATGAPAANATVAVGDRTATTDGEGRVRVDLPADPGRYELTATRGGEEVRRAIRVDPDATREPVVSLAVDGGSVVDRPTARAVVGNPWGEPVVGSVAVRGPGRGTVETVRVPPGKSRTVRARLARRPPGEYEATVALNGSVVGETTYAVTGDERLTGALAASGRFERGGVDGLLERAFGNLGFVLGTLVGLGALMTVGSTLAAFASAAQARRRSIGIRRATGAGPGRILGAVCRDALRIAVPAAVVGAALALVARQLLRATGLLTVFGVDLSAAGGAPPALLAGVVAGAVALAVGSAAAVAAGFVLRDPARLFDGSGGGGG